MNRVVPASVIENVMATMGALGNGLPSIDTYLLVALLAVESAAFIDFFTRENCHMTSVMLLNWHTPGTNSRSEIRTASLSSLTSIFPSRRPTAVNAIAFGASTPFLTALTQALLLVWQINKILQRFEHTREGEFRPACICLGCARA